jgi:hypothetical protein
MILHTKEGQITFDITKKYYVKCRLTFISTKVGVVDWYKTYRYKTRQGMLDAIRSFNECDVPRNAYYDKIEVIEHGTYNYKDELNNLTEESKRAYRKYKLQIIDNIDSIDINKRKVKDPKLFNTRSKSIPLKRDLDIYEYISKMEKQTFYQHSKDRNLTYVSKALLVKVNNESKLLYLTYCDKKLLSSKLSDIENTIEFKRRIMPRLCGLNRAKIRSIKCPTWLHENINRIDKSNFSTEATHTFKL